jgi:hypothetical protein
MLYLLAVYAFEVNENIKPGIFSLPKFEIVKSQKLIYGAPPKHRVLEHRQPKHQILNNQLSITSTVKNIYCQKE